MFRIFRRRKPGEDTAESEAPSDGSAPAAPGLEESAAETPPHLESPDGGAAAESTASPLAAPPWPASAEPAAAEPFPAAPERRVPDAVVTAVAAPAAAVSGEPGEAPEYPAAGLPAGDADGDPDPEADFDVDDSARAEARVGLFEKLRAGLGKTRGSLAEGMGNLLLGRKEITEEALEDLETALLLADVGVEATRAIVARLTESVRRRELADSDALFEALGERLREQLAGAEKTLEIDLGRAPFVIMMVGVNGAGKTTTIGKLAKHLQRQGVSVLLAAGDTFRAAAVEQLQAWGERNAVPVIAQGQGSDSASVIFDAMEAARARGIDVVLADTAGRLQNKQGLMDELSKIRRVMAKFGNEAPHETILVLDGNTGQNGISQAQLFSAAVPVTGLVLTKLDGTAKGGIVFAVARQTGLPIYYVGVGESIDDLRPFEAEAFVKALLERDADGAA